MPTEIILGRRVHWTVAGQGDPALFLHCALADAGAWLGVEAYLGDNLRMMAPDLPGHGRTAHDPAFDSQRQAVDTAAALAARAGRAIHVVGHSYGATVALRLAVEAPTAVKSLTLIEPIYYGFLADAGDPAYDDYLQQAAPFRDAAQQGDWMNAARAFLSNWGSGDPSHLPREHFDALVNLMPLVARSEEVVTSRAPDNRLTLDAIAALKMPVQLIRGSASDPVNEAVHRVIQDRLPAQEHVVAGAGHLSPLSHPKEVADLIREFVN